VDAQNDEVPMTDWTIPANGGWSLLHDVALLYLTCMHGPDAEIDEAESQVVKELLRSKSGSVTAADRVLDDVMLMYVGTSGSDMIATSIASLGDSLNATQRQGLLQEFAQIATADGLVHSTEVRLITEIANRWGLRGPSGDYSTES
jgi:uncharacterized tellurite resistance protein B-like protein